MTKTIVASPRVPFSAGPIALESTPTRAAVITVGRDTSCDLVVEDPQVSGVHAYISRFGNEVRIEDRGSTNGTYVAGALLTRNNPVMIAPEDVVQLGDSALCFFARDGVLHVGWPEVPRGATASSVTSGSPRSTPAHVTATRAPIVQPAVALRVLEGPGGARDLPLETGHMVTLGRAADCTHSFEDPDLSRKHACVLLVGANWMIKDAGSMNGTFVNDARISSATTLQHGDRIGLGANIALQFSQTGAKLHERLPAKLATNTDHFVRWQRLQMSEGRLVACLTSVFVLGSLRTIPLHRSFVVPCNESTEDTCFANVLRFLREDLADLSLDFQPRTFDAAFDALAEMMTDTLSLVKRDAPEAAAALAGMEFSSDQRDRFSDNVAAVCRREFANSVAQLQQQHGRARAGRHLLQGDESGLMSLASHFGLGALAVANPLVGVPMLIGKLAMDSNQKSQKKKALEEVGAAVEAACRWSAEAAAGAARAVMIVREDVDRRYALFVRLVVRAFVDSGVAPSIAWERMCESYLFEAARGIRKVCAEVPDLRDEFLTLDLDPEVRALIT